MDVKLPIGVSAMHLDCPESGFELVDEWCGSEEFSDSDSSMFWEENDRSGPAECVDCTTFEGLVVRKQF